MMDDKGYAFTPFALLLMIPVIIIAVAYGNILNELNMISGLAIGGDVTLTTAVNVFSAMEMGAQDSGRNGAYNATRKVIDERKFFQKNTPDSTSKEYIKIQIWRSMNEHVIQVCRDLEYETGREIYLNDISITNNTLEVVHLDEISITQENPYGFYINVEGGLPIKVIQQGQVYEGFTPPIKVPVSIQGLEDPYIWLNTEYNQTNLYFTYPEYDDGAAEPYNFDRYIDNDGKKLQFLWYCINGTGNPSQIGPRSYYFPDPYGLTFFDRLENRTNDTSTGPTDAKFTSFINGDPLFNSRGTSQVSHVDHEYLTYPTWNPSVTTIKVRGTTFTDPTGNLFYISQNYLDFFDLETNY